ncbi:glycosyl hydrolase family 2 [Bacteroides thetaiotaomicron]|nr:glycosyl hydrolase family 2 [Bacteroides thetaiotaomicron]
MEKIQWPNVIQPRPSNYTFATMPNPVGSYRREFILPDSWKGRDIFIRFNGVEAGFYIWVNGKRSAIRRTATCLPNLI